MAWALELHAHEEAAFWDAPSDSVSKMQRYPITESEIKNNDLQFEFEAEKYQKWRVGFGDFLRERSLRQSM